MTAVMSACTMGELAQMVRDCFASPWRHPDLTHPAIPDSKEKTVAFDNGRLYLTSHRLIYVDAANPRRNSRSLDLALVKQTEQWVGFMKSSPKITLVLSSAESSQEVGGSGAEAMRYAPNVEGGAPVLAGAPERGGPATAAETWNCHVCGFRNLSTGSGKCTLCGVVRSLDAPSKRSSRPGTPTLSAAPAPAPPASPAMEGGLVSCPACTFLNHPSMVRCEVCESPLTPGTSGASSRPSTPVAVSASGPRPATPQPLSTGAGTPPSVRLSFRRGGDKAFYAALKTALKAKAWESEADRRSSRRPAVIATTAGPSGSGGISAASGGEIDTASGHRMTTFGISESFPPFSHARFHLVQGIADEARHLADGILRTIDLDARDRDEDMQEALSDLEALMARAREMVNLAQSLSAKMADSTTESASGAIGGKMDSSEETTVRKSLISLGLATPAFTLEMAQDEKDYHLSLAKELGSVLLGRPTGSAQRPSTEPLMVDAKGRKGIIGLDEIWCLWNRARGVGEWRVLALSHNASE